MRRAHVVAGLAVAAATASVVPAATAVVDPPHDGPVTSPSHSFPDPFVLRLGTTYYAFATDGDLGEVQVMSSSGDQALAGWTNVGNALGRAPSSVRDDDVWAPAVLRVRDDRFVLYSAFEQTATGRRCIGITAASSVAGPYEPVRDDCFVTDDAQGGVIDPAVFSRGGQRWLLWKTEGVPGSVPPRIYSQPLSTDGTSLTGTRSLLLQSDQPWEGTLIENPFLVEDGGRLFLFYSGNEWESSAYALSWAVCTTPAGPCVRPPNRTLLHTEAPNVYGPGGGSVFEDDTGQRWLAFAAWITSETTESTGERGLFLRRLRFIDGRPYVIGADGEYRTSELVARVGGPNRYDTASLFSANTVQANRPVTYVATGASFPDALAAGAASGAEDSPVILVRRDSIPASAAAELARLSPGHIVVMGGTGVISDGVYDQLRSYSSSIHREPGVNRYDTASRVARNTQAFTGDVAYVASGEGFADALGGGAAGAANRGPLLLTGRDQLPDDTRLALDELDPDRIVLLGGTAAVSDAVASELGRYGPVTRIAGANRYETAARLARAEFDAPVGGVVLATGATFPDAVAAGAAGYPVLLVPSTGAAPQEVRDALWALSPLGVVVMGGTAAVSEATLDSLGL